MSARRCLRHHLRRADGRAGRHQHAEDLPRGLKPRAGARPTAAGRSRRASLPIPSPRALGNETCSSPPACSMRRRLLAAGALLAHARRRPLNAAGADRYLPPARRHCLRQRSAPAARRLPAAGRRTRQRAAGGVLLRRQLDSGERGDYRFVGEALASHGGWWCPGLPALSRRCGIPISWRQRQAVRWAFDHAGRAGRRPGQRVVMGHSAGAYNAAMLALDPRWLAGGQAARWPAGSASRARTTSCRSATRTRSAPSAGRTRRRIPARRARAGPRTAHAAHRRREGQAGQPAAQHRGLGGGCGPPACQCACGSSTSSTTRRDRRRWPGRCAGWRPCATRWWVRRSR